VETQELPSIPEEPPRTGADLTKAREELGFAPRADLVYGLRKQVDAALADAKRARRRGLLYRAET
jgi:nucleoside-diphosphate-sugar epimerase